MVICFPFIPSTILLCRRADFPVISTAFIHNGILPVSIPLRGYLCDSVTGFLHLPCCGRSLPKVYKVLFDFALLFSN